MNKNVTFYLPVELIERLKAECAKTNKSQNKIVIAALEKELAK